MTTIKAYTDLEQSKKLAEILPIESADMYYSDDEYPKLITKYIINYASVLYGLYDIQYFNICGYTPCWSLAALINIIPQELFDKEYIINITEGLKYKWIISYEPSFNVSSYIHVSNDNLIDCCVEIISKLKEKNLL